MTIPQAAVDAAAEAMWNLRRRDSEAEWSPELDYGIKQEWRKDATAALEAAMPHLRKQVAEEIRAMEADPFGTFSQRNPQAVRDRAARIAEGETK